MAEEKKKDAEPIRLVDHTLELIAVSRKKLSELEDKLSIILLPEDEEMLIVSRNMVEMAAVEDDEDMEKDRPRSPLVEKLLMAQEQMANVCARVDHIQAKLDF